MNLQGAFAGSHEPPAGMRTAAFTISELMVATAILLLVVGGVISSHLFGMRMMEPTNARQRAADESRKLLNTLANDIRSARTVRLGSGSATAFTEVGMNALQSANAIQVYPTTNTAIYLRYFRDSATKSLRRVTNGTTTSTLVVSGVNTTYPFTFEDFSGNVLTNDQMNSVVGLSLQFSEVGSGGQPVGSGRYFQSYSWKTHIYRRALQ